MSKPQNNDSFLFRQKSLVYFPSIIQMRQENWHLIMETVLSKDGKEELNYQIFGEAQKMIQFVLYPGESMSILSSASENIVYQSLGLEIWGGLFDIFKEVKNSTQGIAYFAVQLPNTGAIKVLDYNIEPDLMVAESCLIGFT